MTTKSQIMRTQKPRARMVPTPRQNGRYHNDDTSRMAVTIGLPVAEVFAFFRNFENLPLFMKDLKTVTIESKNNSHWVVQLDSKLKVEWDAEITNEREGEMIAWRSVEGSEIETSGTVWFSPAPETLGTVVGLTMETKIPGGKLTELVTKMTGEDPDSLAFINLRRLKGFLETGEIATIEGQPSGRDADAEMVQ